VENGKNIRGTKAAGEEGDSKKNPGSRKKKKGGSGQCQGKLYEENSSHGWRENQPPGGLPLKEFLVEEKYLAYLSKDRGSEKREKEEKIVLVSGTSGVRFN